MVVGRESPEIEVNQIPYFLEKLTEERLEREKRVDYIFLSSSEFEKQKARGKFLFWKEIYEEKRAISKELFEKFINSGKKFYTEGAPGYFEFIKSNPKYQHLQSLFIFLPPSFLEMQRRIESQFLTKKEKEAHLERNSQRLLESAERFENNLFF